jgi:uncharacterized GH25 family protein
MTLLFAAGLRSAASAIARVGLGAALLLFAAPVAAHEFWIEPEAYRVEPGGAIRADLKTGQDFKGNVFPYLRDRFVSYRLTGRNGTGDVSRYDGASPSLDVRAAQPGLNIVTYHSTPDRLIYRDWEKFTAYAEYEGLDGAVAEHRARGLPEVDFSETYIRCAKALIQAGPATAQDRDRATGMPMELVAQENPYAGAPPEALGVQLLWRGEPLGGVQIAIFQESGGGQVRRTRLRTDENGIASIPLAGGGRFLLNAVKLLPADPNSGDEWQSHWASLTFAIVAGSE